MDNILTFSRYDDKTSENLAKACIKAAGNDGKIACISAPTAYVAIKKHYPDAKGKTIIIIAFHDCNF